MTLPASRVLHRLFKHQAKRVQYQSSDPFGYAFVLLSTDTFGRLGEPAMALLNKRAEWAKAGGIGCRMAMLFMLCVNSLSGFVVAIV